MVVGPRKRAATTDVTKVLTCGSNSVSAVQAPPESTRSPVVARAASSCPTPSTTFLATNTMGWSANEPPDSVPVREYQCWPHDLADPAMRADRTQEAVVRGGETTALVVRGAGSARRPGFSI